jgi:hypothetical protein
MAQEIPEVSNAESKAWNCVRQALNDDVKYDALRYKGESIELKGSEGGHYILYPNGHVVDLQKDFPKLGRVEKSYAAPYPDVLATTIAWITHDEDKFKKNWGCGSIRVKENEESSLLQHEVPHHHHYQSHWYDDIHPLGHRHRMRNLFMLYMLVFLGVWYFSPQTFSGILPSLTSPFNFTQTNMGVSPNNNTATQSGNQSATLFQTFTQSQMLLLVIVAFIMLVAIIYVTESTRRW